ncbi:MAG TPA: hypothetical protein PLS10_04960 [Chitinophagales bacterium]|nr:hypothetical protein [Chitinophagales bacterium]
MIKYLQITTYLLLSFFCLSARAQNGRTINTFSEKKLILSEKVQEKKLPAQINTSEKSDLPIIKNEIAEGQTQSRVSDSVPLKKDNENNTLKTAATFSSDNNVIYTKEILPESEKISSSEKQLVKVTPSLNYKERVIKEDIHPVLSTNAKVEISSGKRIYLQQEADDLQQEINQNIDNPNYDLAKKQKQLEEIKKMLQN